MSTIDNTVTITMDIKGKNYSIRLDKTQKHLALRAAEYVNKALDNVNGSFATADREVVLTYGIILLADEALDLKEEIKKLQAEKFELEKTLKNQSEEDAVKLLEQHTDKINSISAMINQHGA